MSRSGLRHCQCMPKRLGTCIAVSSIHDLGIRTGVALNHATPLEAVTNVWYLSDLLVVMTVGAGFCSRQ